MEIMPDLIEFAWPDGQRATLPHLWLRDNCQCDSCRAAQTTEKAFELRTVPVDLVPVDASIAGDELAVTWPDGHVSTFHRSYIDAAANPPKRQDRSWGEGFMPTRVSWHDFLSNDATAADAIDSFLVDGVIVLTDGPTEPNTLEDLAVRFGPVQEVAFERIHNVKLDPSGYNIAHTALPLPPHNDMASYRWPPSVQALHFLANETPGGESIIVDAVRIAEQLRDEHPDHFAALVTMPVPFRQFSASAETSATAPLISLDPDGEIAGVRYSNQLMQAIDPTRPGLVEFYRAYHELSSRICDPANEVAFRVEGGECLVVAAHRVLHARKAFEPTGARHLQDAYFEHDNVRNHRIWLDLQRVAAPA